MQNYKATMQENYCRKGEREGKEGDWDERKKTSAKLEENKT